MNDLQLMNGFKRDSIWFNENRDSLRDEFGENNYVAVQDKRVIANNKNHEVLIKELKGKRINPALILIEFIYEKGVIAVL